MRALLALARFRLMRGLAPLNRMLPEALRAPLLLRGVASVPSLPHPPADARPRLLIAPTNTAGQGWQWARAVERELPGSFAASMAFQAPGGFAFPADQVVSLRHYRWSSQWARAQRSAVVSGYSHVLLESGREPFGDAGGRSVERQIADLRDAGLHVALVFHGSDIRSPSAHRRRVALSPFHDRAWEVTRLYELRSRENRALATRLGLPTFVTTPDLLHDLPDAGWLPVVVDPAPWREADLVAPFAHDGPPVVVHAPSVGRFKGSAFIDPVLRRLEEEGLIRYRRATGVPSGEMPRLYGDADIVIDQVVMGIYGVAAIEAMNAGRLVLGHVSQHTRDVVRDRGGFETPVVEVDPETLEAVLRSVVADPGRYASFLTQGRDFAADLHGGRYAVGVLRDFLGG
jgi:hypothetical protein